MHDNPPVPLCYPLSEIKFQFNCTHFIEYYEVMYKIISGITSDCDYYTSLIKSYYPLYLLQISLYKKKRKKKTEDCINNSQDQSGCSLIKNLCCDLK